MAILEVIKSIFIEGYNSIVSAIPAEYFPVVNLLIFSIIISLYAIFTWKFYRSLSKKDLLKLDLRRYNTSSHPFLKKFFASILYLLEYIIILPFLIFFWMAILAIIILLLSEQQSANQVLIITAAIVASVRILSYYSQDLSRDLAKMFPFTILTISVITPNFFSFPRLIGRILELKDFLSGAIYFLMFIVALELVLRVIDTIINLSTDKDTSSEKE
ncbi:hypothetical protein COU60_03710 [Candidatus Pacearchaeota archaeon CG10_big_fil_rev_8_21_14_0_10_34_76]|nr:MAG: hypothetical protein COU60_03710 [Candidatus Pacearchaeota archaeon CG10_big_fil_rev_8_21_14_0_10_34_76]